MKRNCAGSVLWLSTALALMTATVAAAQPAADDPSQHIPPPEAPQAAPASPAALSNPSIRAYEQLGGEATISAAVDRLYNKAQADSQLKRFYEGVDMPRQKAMQKAFLTFAFGGPNIYEGRNLRTAHAHLVANGLNDSHYDIMLEHLRETLKELGIKDELINYSVSLANGYRGEVLGKKPAPAADPDPSVNPKEVDKELASVWNVPYIRYDQDYLQKKYPYYPSNIQFEDNGVPFTVPSIYTCAGCHPRQYEDWQGSMHAQAFRDPIYLGELNLAVKAVGKGITKQCEGCHTAAAVVSGDMPEEFDFKKLSELAKAGVSCDVCHSIKTHTHWDTPSHEPENGSYVLSPGRKDANTGKITLTKYGPFPNYRGCGGGFHECVESPLHLRAELCGGCHQVFHYKEHFPIEHTYNEWKKGIYSVKGIQCQDCHMVDIPTFIRSADTFQKPQRKEYRHFFNGANFTMYFLEELRAKKMGDVKLAANAHNKYEMAVARLQAAADLDITPVYDEKGELAKVKVRVHNKRCGHSLPTSLTNIRQMWLEVTATDEKGNVLVQSGYVEKEGKRKGSLAENTYIFNSDGMDINTKLANDPWEIVSFSRHDVIPPKGYRDVYYTTMGDHKDHEVTFKAKLRFRVADQKIAGKLLSNMPKGFDLNEIYGLTAVPELPVVDMVNKTIKFSTKGEPSKEKVLDPPAERKDESTLFEQLGGEAAVGAAVDKFYDKVLADDLLKPFFEGVDMNLQRAMQTNFMTFAFGGRRTYNGRDLRAVHARLVKEKGLSDKHYDRVLEHFAATLKEMGVKDNLIKQAAELANSVRSEVLGK